MSLLSVRGLRKTFGGVEAADAPGPTFSVGRPRRRIDAVLVGRRVEVRDVQNVRTPAALRGSDHFPVLADLRVGAQPQSR